MADNYIQVQPDSQGKKLQTYENTIGANIVHSEAVTLVTQLGAIIKTLDDKIRVSAEPYTYDIAEGNVADHYSRQILGYDSTVANAIQDVTELVAIVVPVPAAAVAMEVVSTGAQDDIGGTGALTVEVHGLDTNWDSQSEIVTMTGAVAVACGNTYRRINNLHVMTTGTGGVADGVITIQGAGAGTKYDVIGAGGNMSLQCHFTVPDDYTAYITGWTAGLVTTLKNTAARAILMATADWDSRALISGVFHFQDIVVQQAGTVIHQFPMPLKCPARSDIKVSAQRIVGAGTVEASASIQMWLEK